MTEVKMTEVSTKRKGKGARFVRFFPSDWRSGCIGLTFEQEGLYIRICSYIYETEHRLPLDDRQAAKLMGAHTNAYRKVRDQLASIGKLDRTATGWTVGRAERELEAAIGRPICVPETIVQRSTDTATGWNTGQDTVGDTHHNTPIETPMDTRGVFSENANKINTPLIEPIANSQYIPPKSPNGDFDDPYNSDGIEIQPDGRIALVNGTRQFWLAEFGGDDHRLDLALRQVAVQPNSRRPLRAQVEGQLARQAAARRDQDARYAAAVKSNPRNKPPPDTLEGHYVGPVPKTKPMPVLDDWRPVDA